MGNKRIVEFLLSHGADLEATNPAFKNATAVVISVINKQIETVEYLISVGLCCFKSVLLDLLNGI